MTWSARATEQYGSQVSLDVLALFHRLEEVQIYDFFAGSHMENHYLIAQCSYGSDEKLGSQKFDIPLLCRKNALVTVKVV